MPEAGLIQGIAAAIPIANLDTDQIMPKQFLRGIDKSGLAAGVLWDLRFDGEGRPRPGFVLNRPAWGPTRILVAGPNFGCGSSREHAVWGLQQFGIAAVVAASFGEIFYSNAMNNRLLAVMLPERDVQSLLDELADDTTPAFVEIDVRAATLRSARHAFGFALAQRHRRMLLEGLDMIGLSLTARGEIEAFAAAHWAREPWLRDVARRAAAAKA